MRIDIGKLGSWGLGLVLSGAVVGATALVVRHERGVAAADRVWRDEAPPRIAGLGSTRTLEILPLVTWHTARTGLVGEAGLSYLVRTDSTTLLFDVGYNAEGAEPSPLLHNMATLGVSLDEIDALVISHNHLDHVGGLRWQREATFSLGTEQLELSGKAAYVPVPMHYPGLEPVTTSQPTVLAPGVATTGTIPRQLFIGWIEEQALTVNVEGKGLVVLVGCGHQTLPKLLERVGAVFEEPLYGVVGGLHYPVPEGRLKVLGMDGQRRFASGDGPWRPLTEADVRSEIAALRARAPGLVALDPHDSSDEAIGWFRSAFGSAYRDVEVGTPIRVGG